MIINIIHRYNVYWSMGLGHKINLLGRVPKYAGIEPCAVTQCFDYMTQ